MKNLLVATLCAVAMLVSSVSFGQLLDEKNVTITMDLQPVLQLSLQGPDQIDFTFDNIAAYYSGITKYGANILKVSASVSFDLWAVGLSNATNYTWDQIIDYGNNAAGLSVSNIPITALELHQYPANPVIVGGCAVNTGVSGDYQSAFSPYVLATNSIVAANNAIYTTTNAAPYEMPTSTAALATSEKFIAGGTGTGAVGTLCGVVGGSYLTQDISVAGVITTAGYYYVMDYRILPGLPVVFPSQVAANNTNVTAPYIADADHASMGIDAGVYAAPGVYQMYIKYILAEDQ